jgi:predicted acyl esterase
MLGGHEREQVRRGVAERVELGVGGLAAGVEVGELGDRPGAEDADAQGLGGGGGDRSSLRRRERGRMAAMRRTAVVIVSLIVLAAGAGSAEAAAPTARGSVRQVQVTGAAHGARLALLDRRGRTVATRRANRLGGSVFRGVRPGPGYRIRTAAGRTRAFTVLTARSAPPSTKGYRQTLPADGYGYLKTRDGTKLAMDVHLPSGKGPYPTLLEYSGYGYANPDGGESSIAPIANALGFAVVDVNMRGTGCSGGAFDYFEALQGLDGYDAIETIARQPWVLHHKVGMMGISYGGISQLFVAATRPPSLAAIAPLSVIDDTATTLYPGGILNTGFALSWAKERVHDALPASPTGGEAWALKRIRGGDATCKADQALHPEAVDLVAKTHRNRFYVPKVADPLAPVTFVHRIRTPVFLACQWTDEQTGGHCPALASRFTGTRRKWFTFTNGTHIDSLDPATFNRWFDFLELYVARRRPDLGTTRALAPVIYKSAMGIDGVTLPDDAIQQQPTYAAARSAFERLPAVRVLFDNGAGSATPGVPQPGFERSFARWPVPRTHPRAFYLGDHGALAAGKPAKAGADRFTWDPHARPATSFTGDTAAGPGGLWTATPHYHWTEPSKGRTAAYETAPLTHSATVIGNGALTAWIRASAPSVDLQATISEVRPDGRETFVQDGWLRASARKLDARRSTPLAPVLSLRRADRAPLPQGRWTKVTVPLYAEGHAYRKGSRIRVSIGAPRGDQPVWAFAGLVPDHRATVRVAHSRAMPSRLLLPVVAGVRVPTPLPPCPGLRGEPCRG